MKSTVILSGSGRSFVAPFAGAWVEIDMACEDKHYANKSLPSRERGLKYLRLVLNIKPHCVAPFAGAWVEIDTSDATAAVAESLPSRERGLKSEMEVSTNDQTWVAPFAGAWVEIFEWCFDGEPVGRSLPSRERGLK